MFGRLPFLITLLFISYSFAIADDNPIQLNETEPSKQQDGSVRTATPVFGRLLMFSFPNGFKLVSENTEGNKFFQESILKGERKEKWSQMISIEGAKGLALNPNVTPRQFAGLKAAGFHHVCPDTYSSNSPGPLKINGYDSYAVVISCGVVAPSQQKPYSESVLLIAIKGRNDYYGIYWAELGNASETPIEFDDAKWMDRLKRLMPIKLCPIMPGESEPYPSCINSDS